MVSLMIGVDGQSPDDILSAEPGVFLERWIKSISPLPAPTELTSMIKQMKLYALAFKTKE